MKARPLLGLPTSRKRARFLRNRTVPASCFSSPFSENFPPILTNLFVIFGMLHVPFAPKNEKWNGFGFVNQKKKMQESTSFFYDKCGAYTVQTTSGKKLTVFPGNGPKIEKKLFGLSIVDVKCLPNLLLVLCNHWKLLVFDTTQNFEWVDSFRFLRSGRFSSLLVFSSFHSGVICIKNLLQDELILVDIVERRTKVMTFKENLFQPILPLALRGVFFNPFTQKMFSVPTVKTAALIVLCLKNNTVEDVDFPDEIIEIIMEKAGFFGKKRVKMKNQDDGRMGVTTRRENFTDSLFKF